MSWIFGQGKRLLVGGMAFMLLMGMHVYGEDNKDAPKKDAKPTPKKDVKPDRREFPLPKIDELLKRMGPGMDEEQLKELRKNLEEMNKQMERAMRGLQVRPGLGGLPGLPDLPGMRGLPALPGFGALDRLDRGRATQEPRLGAQLGTPSKTLEDQLDLPKDQGLVVEELGPNSAAAKAGLKQHDILLELNGKPVSSKIEEFARQLVEIKPMVKVDAVVMRKGKKETIKGLALPEAKVQAQPDRPMRGRLGGRLRLPGLGGLGRLAGMDGSTSIQRVNDDFTATNRTDEVKITVKGKVEQGKAKVSEVAIEVDGKTKTYESVDKVPAEYKDRVQKLAGMAAGGKARVPQRPLDDF